MSSERGEQGQLGNQRYTLVFIPTSFYTHHSIPRPRAAYGLSGMSPKKALGRTLLPGKCLRQLTQKGYLEVRIDRFSHGSLHRMADLVVKRQGPQGFWEAFGDSEKTPERRARWPEDGSVVKGGLAEWFSTFLMLPSFIQFFMLWGPPTIKLFLLLLYNCNCATVVNYSVNIYAG